MYDARAADAHCTVRASKQYTKCHLILKEGATMVFTLTYPAEKFDEAWKEMEDLIGGMEIGSYMQ